MRCPWPIVFLALACGDPPAERAVLPPSATFEWPAFTTIERLDIPVVDDHAAPDSLPVQVTFALPDGTFLKVAGRPEETTEGLRLYHYRLDAQGHPQDIAISAPAYDSYTMLPTFFGSPGSQGPFLLLANFGEKDSWGQKVMLLDAAGFHDLGFVDAATHELRTQEDTAYFRLGNIALRTVVQAKGDTLLLAFTGDSVHLYDDLQGHLDTMRTAASTGYAITRDGGFFLRDGGRVLRVAKPA
ncbi:MAG TPA: hypothetical protein VGE21_09775 [Flavobacteriales bacterium]